MNESKKSLLPALFAVGTGLTALPASALELGEINVQSTLGQPLRASIAYALGPNEQLANYCVTLQQGLASNGLPAIRNADISVANGIISLTGRTAIREPLMTVRVNLDCPYTPRLSREYMLFIDPATPIKAVVTTNVPSPAAAQPVAQSNDEQTAAVTAPAPRPAVRRAAVADAPINASASYRVQPGDSLSQIAERIENRPIGLWNAVAQIFDANPDAFIDNDPNKLKAGSLLIIPEFTGTAVASNTQAFAPVETNAAATISPSTSSPTATIEPPVEQLANRPADDTRVLEPAASTSADGLRPGDVIVEAENLAAAGGESTIVIPDTEIDAPVSTATSPNVPTARIVAPETTAPSGTNWLLWLVGGGIALIIGLLVFGRRGRDPAAPDMIDAEPTHPMRRASDTGTAEILPDDEFHIPDDSPTEENLALDANLEIGTGLSAGTDVDIRHDFALASTTELDLELPFDDVDTNDTSDTIDTNMIAAPTIESSSILDQEIMPDDEDYDMSVIVDATKMPNTDEVTERDLKAVVVEDTEPADSGYTIDQEVDYQILEQDYEEELTATQALNIEIERAAAELANRLDDSDEPVHDEMTADLQLATVTSLDHARSTVASDEISDIDDTGVNEELTAEMSADDKTVEMPSEEDDSTVEMPNKGGKAG